MTLLTYGDRADYSYNSFLGGIRVVPVYDFVKRSGNRWTNFFRSFFIPFRLRQLLKSADVFQTNQMGSGIVPVIAGLICRRPLVVRCGFEMLRNLLRDEKRKTIWCIKAFFGYLLELIAYTAADKIIISNRSDIDFVKRVFPVNRKKIRLIRNYIDTDYFSPGESFCIKNNDRKALFIGRIESCKNIENLIIGAAAADCSLDIVGKGGLEEHYKEVAKIYGGKVNFKGLVDNQKLPGIIEKYDLYILSSFYECSPKTLLEAMACARVVLGTDVDGIRELIDDSVTGFLCNTDADSIKNAINRIFDTDPEKLNTIARNARNFVVKECGVGPALLRLFKEYAKNNVKSESLTPIPDVTVLMSVYNGEVFLRSSVESILNQSFRNFEFIIIDDGSTDNSCRIIESYNDPRIRLIRNGSNIGLAASLNKGLEYARGELIARQDADDISLPGRLEQQVAFMRKKSDIVLVGTQARDIDENGGNLGVIKKPVSGSSIRWVLLFDNPFVHTSVMFRRETVLRLFKGYNEDFVCSQDYELWSKIAAVCPVANLNTVLVKKRNVAGSITLNVAREKGQDLCRHVHEYNLKMLFKGHAFSEREVELISAFRFGLNYKELKEFLPLFKNLLARYRLICPDAAKCTDFKKAVALQCIRLAISALGLRFVRSLIKNKITSNEQA